MKKIRYATPKALAIGFAVAMMSINANANGYMSETWAGPYFGLHFGSGAGSVDTDYSYNSNFSQTVQSGGVVIAQALVNETAHGDLDGDANGSLADLFVGYNFRPSWAENFIIGGQLEGTFFSDIVLYANGVTHATSQTNVILPTPATTISDQNFSSEYNDDLRSMFTFLARVGYLVMPNLLVYALGGGVEGHFVVPFDEISNDSDFDQIGTERGIWELGYTVGAGLEYRLNNNWSVRGEYRFMHFDYDRDPSFTSTTVGSSGATQTTTISNFDGDYDTDFDFNMGKIGIVYRFDPPPVMVGK